MHEIKRILNMSLLRLLLKVLLFRCRCEKCLEKRKSASISEEDSSAELRKKNICQGPAPSANIELASLEKRKTTTEGREQSARAGEEIILRVPKNC